MLRASLRGKVLWGVLPAFALVLVLFAFLEQSAHRAIMIDLIGTGAARPADLAPHLASDRRQLIVALITALAVGGAALAVVLERLVVKPLLRLSTDVRALAQGDLSRRSVVDSADELGQLAGAFNRMADGLAERDQLAEQVRRRKLELEDLYAALREKEAARAHLLKSVIDAQEAERKRVARQLHDELAQSLTGLVMNLDAAQAALGVKGEPGTTPGRLVDQLTRTREIVAQVLEQTRHLILELRPTMLDDLGLVSALRWYAEKLLAPLGAIVTFQAVGDPRRLSPALETAAFRIGQEAINNVALHSRATKVQVQLVWDDDRIALEVSDNGRGFDVARVRHGGDPTAGLGLLGMQERAEMFAGRVEVYSGAGRGTTVRAWLPTSGAGRIDADARADR
ncbi:MAG: HAMP domain-containing protein [Chloroflexi bacterium CFX6]|nr:HAMP domain-containing protein [Chloroflexi bacterium CFX6]